MNREINKNIILEFDFSIESLAGRFLDFLFGPQGTSSELSKDKVSQLKKSDEKLQKEAEQMRREGKSEEEIEAFLEAARAQMLVATTGWDDEDFEKIENELSQFEKEKSTGDFKAKPEKEVEISKAQTKKIQDDISIAYTTGARSRFANALINSVTSIDKEAAKQNYNLLGKDILKLPQPKKYAINLINHIVRDVFTQLKGTGIDIDIFRRSSSEMPAPPPRPATADARRSARMARRTAKSAQVAAVGRERETGRTQARAARKARRATRIPESIQSDQQVIRKIENYIFEEIRKDKLLFEELKKIL